MNYAGNHRFTQNCYCYPHLSRCCPQLKSTYFLSSLLERPLCCLAFITLIHCSVFKVQSPAFTKTRNKYSIPFEYLFPSLLRLVGPSGLEPPTLRLSVVRSSQLSYGPISRLLRIHHVPSKLNNARMEDFSSLRRSDLGMLHRTCGPVRSP